MARQEVDSESVRGSPHRNDTIVYSGVAYLKWPNNVQDSSGFCTTISMSIKLLHCVATDHELCSVTLRIAIDKEHSSSQFEGKVSRDVTRERRLANAAFVVEEADGDHVDQNYE